jgi:hypothetical protein
MNTGRKTQQDGLQPVVGQRMHALTQAKLLLVMALARIPGPPVTQVATALM